MIPPGIAAEERVDVDGRVTAKIPAKTSQHIIPARGTAGATVPIGFLHGAIQQYVYPNAYTMFALF